MKCQAARDEKTQGPPPAAFRQMATLALGVASLLAGSVAFPTVAQAGSESSDTTDAMSNLTEEVRVLSSNRRTHEIGQGDYEPLDRWEAPPTLAGPLFSIRTVYRLANQAPIVSTDLGPGVRLGAVTPTATRQMTLLQNIIVGPNYAAISLGMR